MGLLERIQSPEDVRALNEEQLPELAQACRDWLIQSLNHCGGHFAASLGATELTIALHYCFDTPRDHLIWDVGHQAYVHKMLTGRKDQLTTIRQQHGIAPFPDPNESEYDHLAVGHSSTSISTALGMAISKQLNRDTTHSIAIIGDGGLTAGMAFEALNHAGSTQANLIVVLNDNDMSISKNVGALNHQLNPAFFQSLGFAYSGEIDGHDISACVAALKSACSQSGPRIVHMKTRKGKGYAPAESDPIGFHYVPAQFTRGTASASHKPTFSSVFSQWLCDQAQQDKKLIGITPAMCEGSGLVAFSQQFPERYIDVGIAEQHAITLATGLALNGHKPVVAMYSTFLQRAYDQLIHDVALQHTDVLIAIDRAGLVGNDGATHQGAFDLSYLRCIPNISILTPSDEHECYHMLSMAYAHVGPAAVRYPRGGGIGKQIGTSHNIEWGKANLICQGKKIAVLNFGALLHIANEVAQHFDATLVDMRFVKPLDTGCLQQIAQTHEHIITIEDNVISGGAGSAVAEWLAENELSLAIQHYGLPDQFIAHASRAAQLESCGMTGNAIIQQIETRL